MKDDKAPAYGPKDPAIPKPHGHVGWTEVPSKPVMPKPFPKDDGPWLRRQLNRT